MAERHFRFRCQKSGQVIYLPASRFVGRKESEATQLTLEDDPYDFDVAFLQAKYGLVPWYTLRHCPTGKTKHVPAYDILVRPYHTVFEKDFDWDNATDYVSLMEDVQAVTEKVQPPSKGHTQSTRKYGLQYMRQSVFLRGWRDALDKRQRRRL